MSSKPKNGQKLLLNKDAFPTATAPDISLPGLFRSTSSLARSLRRASDNKSNDLDKGEKINGITSWDNNSTKYQSNKSSALTSSALLIMNTKNNYNQTNTSTISTNNQQKVISSFNPVTEIRNLTHFYDKLDSDNNTYELLSTLKVEKRRKHLDAVDEFEIWNKKYLVFVNENVSKLLNDLGSNLNKTKDDINTLFSKSDSELDNLSLKKIQKIEKRFERLKIKRLKEVKDYLERIMNHYGMNLLEIQEKIMLLAKKLNLIGYTLEDEIEKIQNMKNSENHDYFDMKNIDIKLHFGEIQTEESSFLTESENNLENFLKRWKNTKLNKFVENLKEVLLSGDFVDNQDRYILVSKLKEDQESIYQSRLKILTEKILNKSADSFTFKSIEQITKQLEEIYNTAQNIYDTHTQKLVENSEHIFALSLIEIEKFKEKIKKINYEFGENKDNYNSNLYNNYEGMINIDDLIANEINPIVDTQKQLRKDYVSKIIAYLDEYDDYTHNICLKLLNIFSQIAIKNDEHRKKLYNTERSYLIEFAKAADHDDEIIYDKEENLKKIIQQIKESIDKEELDGNLQNAFAILDELGIEYKEFFKIVECFLALHEGDIRKIFSLYEENILSIFGIEGKYKQAIILAKRNIESEFLSKVKEAQIASEEAKALLENEKKDPKAKSSAIKKKPQNLTSGTGAKNKKGENVMLIPPREIKQYLSRMNNEYLVDHTVKELVQHNLRNVIYSREDNILNFVPVIEEVNIAVNINPIVNSEKTKLTQAPNTKNQPGDKKDKDKLHSKDTLKGESAKKVPENKSNPNSGLNTGSNFLEQFNPYSADANKVFSSPLSIQNFKLLTEDNIFKEEYLIDVLEKVFDSIEAKIAEDLSKFIERNKKLDMEKREDYLTELDLKLKSLAPRKGKIEVEEYDLRLSEIDKHKGKFESHLKMVLGRNLNDTNANNQLLVDISNSNAELVQLNDKLFKGLEEETTLKGLNEKQKKFKTSFNDMNLIIEEKQEKFLFYSKTSPDNLLQLNSNFIISMHTFSKGGTYSERELDFYKTQIEKLNEETIIKDKKERDIQIESKIKEIKSNMNNLQEKFDKKYSSSCENILAKDAVGEKFGAPRRLANDIVIKIKIKCSQAQDGLNNLMEDLKKLIQGNKEDSRENRNEVESSQLHLEIRKKLLCINNCLFAYGKYLDAFKQPFSQSYSLTRVNIKDNAEYIENTGKDEIEDDERRKQSELTNLGYLTALEGLGGASQGRTNQKDFSTFAFEISVIEEKVKAECSRVYTGEFAKQLNNNSKIPISLISFLQNLKNEMENFRLKCVRDLRTYSQQYLEISTRFPETAFNFIFKKFSLLENFFLNETTKSFKKCGEDSEELKKELNKKLGPYLANPTYKKILEEIDMKENERRKNYLIEINRCQFILLENEEKVAIQFLSSLLNNFEALSSLFDNFIFEEDYIQLGDEEYFKQRKDYNFLLKLKNENKSNLNLDSKRTFKKIYTGLDRNKLKINFLEKFRKSAMDYIQNDEEKAKIIESQSKKENLTKNIIALKLQNNKNLFLKRNDCFENYCKEFNITVDKIIENFNTLRKEEINYQSRWDEMTKELKIK